MWVLIRLYQTVWWSGLEQYRHCLTVIIWNIYVKDRPNIEFQGATWLEDHVAIMVCLSRVSHQCLCSARVSHMKFFPLNPWSIEASDYPSPQSFFTCTSWTCQYVHLLRESHLFSARSYIHNRLLWLPPISWLIRGTHPCPKRLQSLDPIPMFFVLASNI